MAKKTGTSQDKKIESITITVDGVRYPFDLRGSTTVDRLELFRQSQLTIPQVVGAIHSGAIDTFFIAALVFLARRQMGQPAGFMEIADAITWDSDIEIAIDDPAEDDSPKEPETVTPE